MPRKLNAPSLTAFQNWLSGRGYSSSTVAAYGSVVRGLIADLPSVDAATDLTTVRSAAGHRSMKTRALLVTAWRSYAAFVRDGGGPALPDIEPPRAGVTAWAAPSSDDLPERVEDCVGYLLMGGTRSWRGHCKAITLPSLTWGIASVYKGAITGFAIPHVTSMPPPFIPLPSAALAVLGDWGTSGGVEGVYSEHPIVPAARGSRTPASINTIQRAFRHAKTRPAVGVLMKGEDPWSFEGAIDTTADRS